MSNKLTYNIAFLLMVLGTIGLAFENHPGGIGTGLIALFMFIGYVVGDAPRE